MLHNVLRRRGYFVVSWPAMALTCVLLASTRAVALDVCVGDCNSNGTVTIDELITGVNIALGALGIDSCRAFDTDSGQDVTVDELLAGVDAALLGCPGSRGTIIGQVASPRGSGFDVVAGAVVSVVGGPSTVTDNFGRFMLEAQASGRVVINVSGPGERDRRTPDVFGTAQVIVPLAAGEHRGVFPYLMRGCPAVVDGAAGGSLSLDACGGAGGARINFEAASFATLDGQPFSGQVLAEVTALDPTSVTQRSTLPHLLDVAEGSTAPLIFGAVEVRLFAANTRTPLRLAAGKHATTRIEVGTTSDQLSIEQLVLRSYDDATGTWNDEPAGTLVTEGARVFYEYAASHFSMTAVALSGNRPLDACFQVLITDPDPLGLDIEVYYPSFHPPTMYTARAHSGLATINCIPVLSNTTALIHLRRPTTPGSDIAAAEAWYPCSPSQCTSGHPTGPPTYPGGLNICQSGCGANAISLPPLQPVLLSCLSGRFTRGDVAGQQQPLTGPVQLVQNGNVIEDFDIPRSGCQDICIPVPLLSEAVDLRDRGGNSITFQPSGAAGAQCQQPTPCTHSGGCQELAPFPTPVELTCTRTEDCIFADFTYQVVRDPTCMDPAKPFRLVLDGSNSTGPVQRYWWLIYRIDPPIDTVQNPSDQALLDRSVPVYTTANCLAPVLYQVYLHAIGTDVATAPVAIKEIRLADPTATPTSTVTPTLTITHTPPPTTTPGGPQTFPELVSVNMAGGGGNADSADPAVNGDGRFVVFISASTDLTANGSAAVGQVYVRDTCLGFTAPQNCTPVTTLVSVESNTDVEGNGPAGNGPAISADGRFVAFSSRATNLVAGVTGSCFAPPCFQIYLRDTCGLPNSPVPGCIPSTKILSVDDNGIPNGLPGFRPSISPDGRFVAFEDAGADIYIFDTCFGASGAPPCVPTDVFIQRFGIDNSISGDGRFVAGVLVTEMDQDLTYLNDTCGVPGTPVNGCTPTTTLVSQDSNGAPVDGLNPSLSSDGRFVAFHSSAANLIAGAPPPLHSNVYVRDTCLGPSAPAGCVPSTKLISVDENGGNQGNGNSDRAWISAAAGFVAFASTASNLVPNDGNGAFEDIFLRHTCLEPTAEANCVPSTMLLSTRSNGTQGNGGSARPGLSRDGRFVAFESTVKDLVPIPNVLHTQIYLTQPPPIF